MRDTLSLLRLEHWNLSRLLGVIEEQVTLAEAGERMDEELLRLAAEYFCDYPDRCHHPKEDLVYQLLVKRHPAARTELRDLLADHRHLHELAQAFADTVRPPAGNPAIVDPAARNVIAQFTQHYRQHMRLEEERFFRLAAEQLSRDDWDLLDFTMFDEDDPLFDSATERRFAGLRGRIEALAERDKARRAVVEAAEELRGLTGIESFNEMMTAAGRRARLLAMAKGGYGLEIDRELVLCIPDCPAERAAWCAYCFLQGSRWRGPAEKARGVAKETRAAS
jgi:hemerythrin-like domain-containing protein